MNRRPITSGLVLVLLLSSCAAAQFFNKKVVFIGDSITHCWSPGDSACPFTPALPSPGLPYPRAINTGVSGETLVDMDNRFNTSVLAQSPDIVVILGGTNDLRLGNSLPVMKAALLDMIRQARAAGMTVVVGTVPPSANPQISLPLVLAFNMWILHDLEVDCTCGTILLADYFSAMADASGIGYPKFFADGTHPNLLGYQIMTGVVMDAINGL